MKKEKLNFSYRYASINSNMVVDTLYYSIAVVDEFDTDSSISSKF